MRCLSSKALYKFTYLYLYHVPLTMSVWKLVSLCSSGVEVAAALVGKAKTVTVVDVVEAPFQLALGKEVGNAVRKV